MLEDEEGREDADRAGERQRQRRHRRGQSHILKHAFPGGQLHGHRSDEAQHRPAAQPHVQPATALGSLLAPHAQQPHPPARGAC